jgi:carbonic anhydrase/acetyltransferase-like protein (isoleucine patch superfamily)
MVDVVAVGAVVSQNQAIGTYNLVVGESGDRRKGR